MDRRIIYVLAFIFIPALAFGQATISGLSALSERPATGDLMEIVDVSDTSMSANGTNKKITTTNLLKQWSYIYLLGSGFKMRGSSTTAPATTQTDFNFALPKFSNSADKANNYVDWVIAVPPDIDTGTDLTAKLQFYLDTVGSDGDHEYIVSMVSIAASAAAAGTPANAVSLGYTTDGSSATGDYEATSETTLTDWKSNVTAGQLWRIRLERDGDHANDTSAVDSYPLLLILKYQTTQ